MPCCLNGLHMNRRTVLGGLAASGLSAAAMPRAALSAVFPDGDFTNQMLAQFAAAGGDALGRIEPFTLTGKTLPWDLKLGEVPAGAQVTFLLSGRWHLLRELDLWFEPGLVFFARVPGEKMYSPMDNAGTMSMGKGGVLEIARSAGEWANAQGELWTPTDAYTAADGRIEGVAIIWNGDATQGIEQLHQAGDPGGLVSLAKRRLLVPDETPDGWQNHYSFGEAGVFTKSNDQMQCHTHKNVSIIQRDVDFSLTDDLRLDWRWLVDELPSVVGEDQIPTHDYLSIGVEFDDGQDITYLWSTELEEGYVFRCPLPGWNAIETHVVQRSGRERLGQWFDESRMVTEDYQSIIGGPAKKVVRVWLLGVSVFQRRSGSCRYEQVTLGGAETSQRTSLI